jgi:hypothetical protein
MWLVPPGPLEHAAAVRFSLPDHHSLRPARRHGFALVAAGACDGGASRSEDAASDAEGARGGGPDAAGSGGDAASAAPDTRIAVPDAGVADGSLTDAGATTPDAGATTPDAAPTPTPDATGHTPDATPPPTLDAAPPPTLDATPPPTPDAAPPLAPSIALDLGPAGARLDGPAERLPDGAIRLDPGASVTFTVPGPPPEAGTGPRVLRVAARIWRVEDGEVQVDDRRALIPGDADAPFVDVVSPWDEALDRPMLLPADAAMVTLRAAGGTLELYGVRLDDPRTPLPPGPVDPAPPPAADAFDLAAPAPCAAPACDDTPALAAALAAAPSGPVRYLFDAATYTLRTPWVIHRPDTHLAGRPGTVLRWDPAVAGEQAALTFGGGGRGAALALAGDHVAGTRRLTLAAPLSPEADTGYVYLIADDFGEVPAICLAGRDVERFQRHIIHPARVVAGSADGLEISLDRGLALDIPAGANPRVQPFTPLPGARVSDLHLLAACPAALLDDTVAPGDCDTPEVTDDDGIALRGTVGARLERVSAQAFGKFTIRVDGALETRLVGNHMDHPSHYGDGGRGYGVHVIGSGRTLIRDQSVDTCRHAVVVDFGASDTQIIGGHLARAHLAVVDVHGEASRDTLVRDVTVEGGLTGVLVGGGGTAVHCNDGPRHHLHRNRLVDNGAFGVSVSNATRQVTLTGNVVAGSAVPLSVTLGAGDVVARHNTFVDSRDAPVFVDDTSGPVRLERNTFGSACDPESVLVGGGANLPAGAVVQIDNDYCPGDPPP